MKNNSIIILTTDGDSLPITYEYLSKHINIEKIIIEKAYSKRKMIQYRVKKQGYITVIGQLLFIIFSKFLKVESKNRKNQILNQYGLTNKSIPKEKITRVNSVNSKACRKILKSSKADFILVNGTRIIGKRTLNSTKKKFVNIHAGITPKYRGVHGGYWALAQRDSENFGVTLHYVDTGVDTGDIIDQSTFLPAGNDNYATYPLLQQIEGLKLLNKNIDSIIENQNGYNRDDLPSKQWFHPTLFGYLSRRIRYNVK